MDGNFDAGQAAALLMLDPIFQIIDESIHENTIATTMQCMLHPRRSIQEMAGELLDLQHFSEASCAGHVPDATHILSGNSWSVKSEDGSGYVGAIKMLDSTLVAVNGDSTVLSCNRAALLVTRALRDNPLLRERLAKCQANVARGPSRSVTNDEANPLTVGYGGGHEDDQD